MLEELAALKSLGDKDAVVIYVSADALLADDAKVHILPAGANPDDPNTWIALRVFLEKLRASPARHQLLVLDIMKPQRLPRLGQLYQDVAGALAAELEAVPDPRRLVLTACALAKWRSTRRNWAVLFFLITSRKRYAVTRKVTLPLAVRPSKSRYATWPISCVPASIAGHS